MYKVQQGMPRCMVLRNNLYKTKSFVIAKTKAILLLIKPISKEKNTYTDTLNRRDLTFD